MTFRQFANILILILTVVSVTGCTTDNAEMCEAPKNLSADHITYNSASVGWTPGRYSGIYELQYKALDSTVWKIQMCTVNFFNMTGLSPLTSYQFRLKPHCGNISAQTSAVASFTTDSLVHFVYFADQFSPNDDGVNDTFTFSSPIIQSVNMQIYNRWGNKVYDSGAAASTHWDGTYHGSAQAAGTYLYSVTLLYIDGYVQQKEGQFILLR